MLEPVLAAVGRPEINTTTKASDNALQPLATGNGYFDKT